MLKLPVYLRGTTYYVHLRIQGDQVKRSLKTGDRKTAMLRASQFMLHVLPMTIRKYEIDIGRGIFKSDGEDDHKRMREAMDDISRLGILTPKSQNPTPSKTSPPGLRLPALCEKFFELRKNLKPATALAYKKSANQFAGFIGNPVLSDIGKSDVTRWQEDLSKSIQSERLIIKSAF